MKEEYKLKFVLHVYYIRHDSESWNLRQSVDIGQTLSTLFDIDISQTLAFLFWQNNTVEWLMIIVIFIICDHAVYRLK